MPLRDVSWRWTHLAICSITVLILAELPRLLDLLTTNHRANGLWIPFSLISQLWMLAYPLWLAGGRGPFPGLRRVTIEVWFTLLSMPVVLAATSMAMALTSGSGANRAYDTFEMLAGSPQRYQAVALVLLAVGAAPFGEEMFFRGMLYNFLRQRMHYLPAALIQAVIFAFYHPWSISERVGIATMGFALALLYEWRKTLIAPIALHMLINALSMAMLFQSVALAAQAPVLGVRGEPVAKGCSLLEVVPDGSAADAGLRAGDVITHAGENSVRDHHDLIQILRTKKPGDKLPVWYTRDGEDGYVEVILKGRP